MLCISDRKVYAIGRDGASLRGVDWNADVASLHSLEQLEIKERRAAA